MSIQNSSAWLSSVFIIRGDFSVKSTIIFFSNSGHYFLSAGLFHIVRINHGNCIFRPSGSWFCLLVLCSLLYCFYCRHRCYRSIFNIGRVIAVIVVVMIVIMIIITINFTEGLSLWDIFIVISKFISSFIIDAFKKISDILSLLMFGFLHTIATNNDLFSAEDSRSQLLLLLLFPIIGGSHGIDLV